MTPQTEQPTGSPRDTVLMVVALLLLAGGIVGFYYLAEQLGLLVRTLLVLGSLGASAAVLYQTQMGRSLWGYIYGSRIELRKTTWPTKQESIQTTLMIAVVVLITALMLWGLDSLLLVGVKALTGRG